MSFTDLRCNALWACRSSIFGTQPSTRYKLGPNLLVVSWCCLPNRTNFPKPLVCLKISYVWQGTPSKGSFRPGFTSSCWNDALLTCSWRSVSWQKEERLEAFLAHGCVSHIWSLCDTVCQTDNARACFLKHTFQGVDSSCQRLWLFSFFLSFFFI